jgi:prolyl-tRNA synthetase
METKKTTEKKQNAINPTREENFSEWYQQVIKAADMAENSVVRGCMVIKPWGWGIWENIQKELDVLIKETGHQNAYFPLLIPVSFLEKEAAHIDGFAKECAVVTHHRLEEKDGKLVPTGELEEPLVIRPTSETIIGECFSRWVKSYRDLPLLINQWANVMRWEMRPRLFLRSAEFLWQEGHTVHESKEDAEKEVLIAVEMYRKIIEEFLAIPVIIGEKPAAERFPGAENTFTLEAMMQDGKALQAGTSHYLGQNFAKAQEIKFLNSSGELCYAHTTSWGASTRLIGGLIMTHSDDDGLRLPPKIAPKQIVIIPVVPNKEAEEKVFSYCRELIKELSALSFNGAKLKIEFDKRDLRGGEKSWQWIKKGIPLRIEVGPRDIESNSVVMYRRDCGVKDKQFLSRAELVERVSSVLEEIQTGYFEQALAHRKERVRTDLKTFAEFAEFFRDDNFQGGFVRAKWSEDEAATMPHLAQLKVSIRCLPIDGDSSLGVCIITGKPATREAIFARAY